MSRIHISCGDWPGLAPTQGFYDYKEISPGSGLTKYVVKTFALLARPSKDKGISKADFLYFYRGNLMIGNNVNDAIFSPLEFCKVNHWS